MMAKGEKFVTFEEGEQLARELGALCYVECSALKQLNLDAPFQVALTAHNTSKGILFDYHKKKCIVQ